MTDIYISGRNPPRRRGCLVLALLALALTGGAGLLLRGCKRENTGTPEQAPPGQPERLETAVSPPPGFQSDWDAVKRLYQTGQLDAARSAGEALLGKARDPASEQRAEEVLTLINRQMVFSPVPMVEKADHIIQRGETLGGLADRYGTTVSLIMRANNLGSHVIRVGDRLRIFQGKLLVRVDKSDNVLKVYLNDAFFLRYRVGTGQHSRTPAGQYRITLRQKHPTWYRPDGKEIPYGDPENLLGTHYLKLNTPGIGLHGTWEPASIGSQSSAGCVRLLNEQIEELHDLLPVGTAVEIVE